MAVIRQLKNWFTKQNIYPQTVEQAIYDSEGRRLDNKIANGLSNPNLLINADFRNPVNQRGGTSWSGATRVFTIDRWAMLRGTVTQTDKCLVCSYDGISDGYLNLHQRIEITPSKVDDKVTVSVKIDGEIITGTTSKYLSDYTNDGEFDSLYMSDKFEISVNVKNAYLQVNLVFKSTEGQTIEWAKAELGSIATPFRPRLYAEELQLCKRYYQLVRTVGNPIYVLTSSKITSLVNVMNPMRIVPKASIVSADVCKNGSGLTGFTYESSVVGGSPIETGYWVYIYCNKENHGLTYANYLSVNAYIRLDAEL